MRIALDARVLTSTDSGLGHYTLKLAQALLEVEKDLELVLVCTTPHRQRRLHEPRIQEVVYPCPARFPLTLFALGPFLAPAALRCLPLTLGADASETPLAGGGNHA